LKGGKREGGVSLLSKAGEREEQGGEVF